MENLSIEPVITRLVAAAVGPSYVMRMPTGRQVAAARALLGWTQEKLSKNSGLSPSSVQRAEQAGDQIPGMRTGSLFAMVRTLEQAGIVFIDAGEHGGVGVRLRRS